jgi:hypothetical protein
VINIIPSLAKETVAALMRDLLCCHVVRMKGINRGGAALDSCVPPVEQVEIGSFHQRPQSSSASRFTAGCAGFFILSQSGERPLR